MKYIYTSEEVQPIADAIAKFLTKHKYKVGFEAPLNNKVSYRTTLLAQKASLCILVDVQNKPAFEGSLKELLFALQKDRVYSELYIATHESANPTVKLLNELRQNGVGLILASETAEPEIFMEPQNPALIVCPDPTLRFGPYKSAVKECLSKFHSPNSFLTPNNPRKDALRDLCELVEGLTEQVAVASITKGYLQRTEEKIRGMKWSDQINVLAAADAYIGNQPPFVSEGLKADLHSFRNGRNLVDHKVRSKREEAQRQQKFPDRMITGIRLIADLVSLKATIMRKKKAVP